MWALARRPRWIGALILALALAAGFAALGQWQLARSIADGTVVDGASETVVPLGEVAAPQGPVSEVAAGQRVELGGSFVPGDYLVVSDRVNDGRTGYWVVGRVDAEASASSGPAALAVAVGWAATEEQADSAAEELNTSGDGGPVAISGRYLPSESPQTGDFENGALDTLSVSQLINLWTDLSGDVYGGFVVSDDAPAGLVVIDSPEPSAQVTLNLLNLFYAAEWAVFAGFAIFMWYRLVKDAWERETELAAEEAELAELSDLSRRPS